MAITHPYYNGFSENFYFNGKILEGGFLPESTRIIIMGTFPPPAVIRNFQEFGLNQFFYYNSSRNQFWNRIESFVPVEKERWKHTKKSVETLEQNVSRKKILCTISGWGFMDLFSKVERRNPKSAKDVDLIDIENVVANKFILDAIIALPKIERICCVYQTAYISLIKALEESNIELTLKKDTNTVTGYKHIWKHSEALKEIEIVLLYPATRSRDKKEVKDKQYEYFLK